MIKHDSIISLFVVYGTQRTSIFCISSPSFYGSKHAKQTYIYIYVYIHMGISINEGTPKCMFFFEGKSIYKWMVTRAAPIQWKPPSSRGQWVCSFWSPGMGLEKLSTILPYIYIHGYIYISMYVYIYIYAYIHMCIYRYKIDRYIGIWLVVWSIFGLWWSYLHSDFATGLAQPLTTHMYIYIHMYVGM